MIRKHDFFNSESLVAFDFDSWRTALPNDEDHPMVHTYWKHIAEYYDEHSKEPSKTVKWAIRNNKDITIGEAATLADMIDMDLWSLLIDD